MASRPTHSVVLRRRTAERNGRTVYSKIGVAWLDEASGNMNITLNDGVVLDWRMMESHGIACYKSELSEHAPQHHVPGEDDISF